MVCVVDKLCSGLRCKIGSMVVNGWLEMCISGIESRSVGVAEVFRVEMFRVEMVLVFARKSWWMGF